MFRNLKRKWWKLYLTLARAWARCPSWHLNQRVLWGKLATNRVLLSLWFLGAALYAANGFFIRDCNCGSGAQTAAAHSVKDEVQQTGSVGQTPPAAVRWAEVGVEPSDARPATATDVSNSGGAQTLPSVWRIKFIDPATLQDGWQDGWISGAYLTPKETPHVQAALPQEPAQPAPETGAALDQAALPPSATDTSAASEQLERSQPTTDASADSAQLEPLATPRDLRKQRRRAPPSTFLYDRGFYPTR
jgi:hypothetical protein